MAKAKKGDRVRINFTGKTEDGTVIETTFEDSSCCDDGCDSCEYGPLEIVIGEEEFFPKIEEALVGMSPGEKKTVRIAAVDAFGEYDAGAVFTLERNMLPDDMSPEVGEDLILTGEDDEELEVTVVEMTDKDMTFDANHPLAGEDLIYDVELVEIL